MSLCNIRLSYYSISVNIYFCFFIFLLTWFAVHGILSVKEVVP